MLPPPTGRSAPLPVAGRESTQVHFAAATPLLKIAGLKQTAAYSVVADSICGPATAQTAAWTHLRATVVELRKTPAGSAVESSQELSAHRSASQPSTER